MAPRRKRLGVTFRATDREAEVPTSYLDRLPTELVDRICELLAERDTLLHLRLTCRALATKTLDKYAKVYWTEAKWQLSASGWSYFIFLTTQPLEVASYLTHLTLMAPPSTRDYDDFVLAKGWGSGANLAKAYSSLDGLQTFSLVRFDFIGSAIFLHDFLPILRLPKLLHLDIERMRVEDIDLSTVVANHKQKLHRVALKHVDLYCGSNGPFLPVHECIPSDDEPCRHPWSTAFESLLQIKHHCFIHIKDCREEGSFLDLLAGKVFAHRPIKWIWDTMIESSAKFTEDGEVDYWHEEITILRNQYWKKALRRIMQVYDFQVHNLDHEDEPPWKIGKDNTIGAGERMLAAIKAMKCTPRVEDATLPESDDDNAHSECGAASVRELMTGRKIRVQH
jgi:hypothetical protein